MCGIVGVYGNHSDLDLSGMASCLNHRGPDFQGAYDDENCFLGHCRLSIIDLSPEANQPMTNEDGSIVLVVNGEIYNYKEARESLRSRGHTFNTQSDSEVIVHAYEEFGDNFVKELRGMFALALYDKKKNKLILARDPIGKKPLYYNLNGRISFASEIKALFKAGVPCEVNYDMLANYLMYQYTIGSSTLFKDVFKIPAGNMLVATPERIKLERYWHISDEGYYLGSVGNPIKHLRELLEESVKLRLQSDVPVGAFLSGGIDSSAVTALYRKLCSGDIHTFTASFDTKSEAGYASYVSKYLGTIFHEVKITPEMVARDIQKITWHHDEPLGDAATINNYYLSQEAKKYVTVVLAGEGGDELFGGYPWYKYSKYISIMSKIPKPIREIGKFGVQFFTRGDITDKSYRLGRMALFPCQDTLSGMQLYPTTAMNEENIKWLTNLQYESRAIIPEFLRHSYNKMLAMDCLNKLPEQFLMKADKATMAWAIEERLPLLDKKIIEFAFSIDPKLKQDKYVLRKSVEDLLPASIVWRGKQGFGTPLTEWLNGGLKEMALDRLNDGALLHEICKRDSLNKMVKLLDNGLQPTKMMALNPANVIWSLFALQIWYDVWFGGGIE